MVFVGDISIINGIIIWLVVTGTWLGEWDYFYLIKQFYMSLSCWLVVTGTMEFYDFPFSWE